MSDAIKDAIADDANIIAESIKKEKVPAAKHVKFEGSLAEYFSDLLIKEGSKGADSKTAAIIYTVETKEDMDEYVNKTKKDEFIKEAVYIKPPSTLDKKLSMEDDIEKFAYHLRIKEVPTLTTEEEVVEFYKEEIQGEE